MQKAEQAALVQSANQQLIAIRQSQLDYYQSFYGSFGNQCALIAGFVVSGLTSIAANAFDNTSFGRNLFWVASAISLGLAITCLLMSMFISVFGPGLALRGPEGSMARAVDGMEQERRSVLTIYTLTVVSYAVSAIGVFWVVMDVESSIICSVIFGLFAYSWYYYCLRIYNRFQFKLDPKLGDMAHDDDDEFGDQDKSERPRFGDDRLLSNPAAKKLLAEIDSVSLEGHLGKKAKKGIVGGIIKDPWDRRYFVLKGSNLQYYVSKQDFQLGKAIKKRPINLDGYSLLFGANKEDRLFYLKPSEEFGERRMWELRCDTDEEILEWKNALNKVCENLRKLQELSDTLSPNVNGKGTDGGRSDGGFTVIS